jgi:cyclopropane-fatty-acyl-phospholipid synthase
VRKAQSSGVERGLRGIFTPQNTLVRERTAMAGSTNSHVSTIHRWLVRKLYTSIGAPNVRFVVGENDPYPADPTGAAATVKIDGWRTLASLALNPEIGFGDSYSEGRIEIDGDLVQFLE